MPDEISDILTACNTGLGKNLTGEGVMGMGRAFQYADARSVLMSLWSIEDESTNLLTERFFSYLKAGKDKLEALRLARSDICKAGYQHPFFLGAVHPGGGKIKMLARDEKFQ